MKNMMKVFNKTKKERKKFNAESREEIAILTKYLVMFNSQMDKWTTLLEVEEWYNNHDIMKVFNKAKKGRKKFNAEVREEIAILTKYLDMLDSQMEKWTTLQEAEEWFNNHDIDSKLKHIKLFR